MSKILIVDDAPHIRELSKVFLQNAGFEVCEAVDGLDVRLYAMQFRNPEEELAGVLESV